MYIEIQKEISNLLIKMNNTKIKPDLLNTIVLDITRVADKEITSIINKYKKNENVIVTSPEKDLIRKKILGYEIDAPHHNEINNYLSLLNKESYLENAYSLIKIGLERNEDNVIGTIFSRMKIDENIPRQYYEFIKEREKNFSQLIYIEIKNNSELNNLLSTIREKYDDLENYHYCLIEFKESCNWKTIYKTAIFAENFKTEENLNAFKSNQKISQLKKFVQKYNGGSNLFSSLTDQAIEDFYSGVNYGFHFQDLILTEDGKRKLLVLQKVELDENPVPCPSCFETNLRGNSYPKMLYKSFECQNPNCPSRSKIGRGKRFDYFSVKRNNKLIIEGEKNYISSDLRKGFRRDIVSSSADFLNYGIKFYTWQNNKVTIINSNSKSITSWKNDRKINTEDLKCTNINEDNFSSLTVVKLFKEFFNSVSQLNFSDKINEYIYIGNQKIINGNSTIALNSSSYKNLFDLAITSPPYFNAREYSQWESLIMYLFDMLVNAMGVLNSLKKEGIYAYNIGDIVDRDNVYVSSNMSNKRQMLGFYSMLIFEIAGFTLIGNDIWDKGEVQSKRNSSSNSFPGFLKPINCYEHIIYFQKGAFNTFNTKVKKMETVKKINSKGENLYGHTAPYPETLVQFVLNRLKKGGILPQNILDPFLGSGTTTIVAYKNKISSTGFELSELYYKLCIDRVNFIIR